jgi:hypothetical protein
MALTTLPTAALANDAVDNTKLNLADNYAFTGTVSGASDVALISTQTTGSASAIDFTGLDNTYNMYMVTYQDLQFASADQTFIMRISDDNGSTVKTSGYLTVADLSYYNGGTLASGNAASVNYHLIATDVGNASDNRSCFGQIYFRTPATARKHSFLGATSIYNDNGDIVIYNTATVYNTNQTFNGIRFLGSSNFAGTFKLYGYN